MKYDLLVLGCGPAGQKAALSAAKLGKKVAIIEPLFLGGICTHVGTVPSKTFREAAIHSTNYRLRFMDTESCAPPTMADLKKRVTWVIAQEVATIRKSLQNNKISVIAGHGRLITPNKVRVFDDDNDNIGEYEGENIVIATGTRPHIREDIEHTPGKVYFTDNILNMTTLPRSITIIGGGIIGCEYASIFSILGVKVNLVEKRSEVLSLIDREMRANLITQLDQRKVLFHFSDEVDSLKVENNRVVIHLGSGKIVRSEAALFCTFRVVNTEQLNLAEIGVEVTDRGTIKVDQDQRTSVPNIFAAGDVVGHPALASTSFEQGRIAGTRAFGAECQPMSPHIPIGIYTIPEISFAGPTEEQLTKEKIPYQVGIAYYKDTAKGAIIGALDGVLKLMFHQETKQLLAIHVSGENATELVHIGQAVLEHSGSVEYFVEKVFNYPTMAEAYKLAAMSGLNRMKDI